MVHGTTQYWELRFSCAWDCWLSRVLCSVEPLAKSQARFDLLGFGQATAVEWIRVDDALLVLDRNDNASIDNAREIFGNFVGGRVFDEVATGFDHLATYDEVGDGIVDAGDRVFADLCLWQDANGNGVSEPGELRGLLASGLGPFEVRTRLLWARTDR